MTNLKLNKLLYYAQGTFLARTGKPLFDNNIEAWSLGPVIPEVYQKYKICGKKPIFSDDEQIDCSRFISDEMDVLYDVMRELGQYTRSKLITLTHKAGTPWSNAIETGTTELNRSDIYEYFVKHPIQTLCDVMNKIPRVDKLPADWYDPNEDAEWEAYI